MFKKKILFFIVFLTIPLSSCSLRKNDTKINQIGNKNTSEEKKISNVIGREEKETLGEELNMNSSPNPVFVKSKTKLSRKGLELLSM